MTAKVENLCMSRINHNISVEANERACINCIYYEKRYRNGRGNIKMFVEVSKGYCLLNECARGALRQPCKKFEMQE